MTDKIIPQVKNLILDQDYDNNEFLCEYGNPEESLTKEKKDKNINFFLKELEKIDQAYIDKLSDGLPRNKDNTLRNNSVIRVLDCNVCDYSAEFTNSYYHIAVILKVKNKVPTLMARVQHDSPNGGCFDIKTNLHDD